ncbi:TRAP transporter small permease [Pseudorhodobacter antarcticus]|jgi:TRAP-type C4-dicarboxylate transport system permease small subunit|nr:TRAP transporter small permease subunit [Pseudorhodobacter antarcticus]
MIERFLLQVLIASIAFFVLMNVLLRMIGITIAWADEMAVYAMVLSGFVGASLMLRARIDPAVLLLQEVLPKHLHHVLRAIVSGISASFGLVLCYLCWLWFNPAALVAAGFDVAAFEAATFNFVYTNVTPIMGVPTFFFFLILPFFAVAITVHALTNLCEDLGLLDRGQDPAGLFKDEVQ